MATAIARRRFRTMMMAADWYSFDDRLDGDRRPRLRDVDPGVRDALRTAYRPAAADAAIPEDFKRLLSKIR